MKRGEKMKKLSTVMRVSLVTLAGNLLLSAFKLIAGLLGHSGAMISDAVHSASDVFSTIIVMIGARLSERAADQDHPYGHERLECAAALILASVLAATGIAIGYSGAMTLVTAGENPIEVPSVLALIAAAVSIVTKEAMYWYTRHHARRVRSTALMADAWHHRSDALSSVGALVGIGGSLWFGVTVLEPIAQIGIALLIVKAAYDIFRDALDKMVDHACDPETEAAIRQSIQGCEGVQAIDLLQTRRFGSRIYVEAELQVDGTLPLTDAHTIAERVHNQVEQDHPDVKHITIHLNPTK